MTDVTVYGAGAFGTALAISLARDGRSVALVPRDADTARALAQARVNARRLPGHPFPPALTVAQPGTRAAPIALIAVPTQVLGAFVDENRDHLGAAALVACCKGIETTSLRGPTGILGDHVPGASTAVLSGPGFAVDIAAGLPTAMTLASEDGDLVNRLQRVLSTANLRLYRSADVRGVELGGALKNVVAIAAGVVIGAGLGESARAALMTRGFAEMRRLAAHLGAEERTLAGLSGLGDLVLTCTSDKSRNFRHGLALGRGTAPEAGATVEGVATARSVSDIGNSNGIPMPITDAVVGLTQGGTSVNETVGALMARPLTEE